MSQAPLNSPCKIRSAKDDRFCHTEEKTLLID